jgi:hypothetical protein
VSTRCLVKFLVFRCAMRGTVLDIYFRDQEAEPAFARSVAGELLTDFKLSPPERAVLEAAMAEL